VDIRVEANETTYISVGVSWTGLRISMVLEPCNFWINLRFKGNHKHTDCSSLL